MINKFIKKETKINTDHSSFQNLPYTEQKIVFINPKTQFVLPAIYDIGNGNLSPQKFLYKIVLHQRSYCNRDCRVVLGELLLAGLPFIQEVEKEPKLDIAMKNADFIIVHPLIMYPLEEMEKNIKNEFNFVKSVALSIKKMARKTAKVIVISPYVGIFEYLIMLCSGLAAGQISGISRYAEKRAEYHIAKKLGPVVGVVSNVMVIGDNIVDCSRTMLILDKDLGKAISLWEVLQIPKPLLSLIRYNEEKEYKSIIPADIEMADRVNRNRELCLFTIKSADQLGKYILQSKKEEIEREVLIAEERAQILKEEERKEKEKWRPYEESIQRMWGEDFEIGKHYDMEGYVDEMSNIRGYNESEIGEHGEIQQFQNISQKSLISDSNEVAFRNIYKLDIENDEEEPEEEEEITTSVLDLEGKKDSKKENAKWNNIISVDSDNESSVIEKEFSGGFFSAEDGRYKIKKKIMEIIDHDMWCKYSLQKLVKDDEPPTGYALASSFMQHFQRIIQGAEKASSMIVMSEGCYGIPKGMFASFPVKIGKFTKNFSIVKDADLLFSTTYVRIREFVNKQRKYYCYLHDLLNEDKTNELENKLILETSTEKENSDTESAQMNLMDL